MRKQRWMRPCAAVLAVLMSVALPMEAWAATEGQQAAAPEKAPVQTETTGTEQAVTPPVDTTGTEVAYVDATGAEKMADKVTAVTAGDVAWTSGWYVVNSDITTSSSVDVKGDVHLILADGCKLTVTGCIKVAKGDSLTIYGQQADSGALVADASQLTVAAAIGGRDFVDVGHITINGGKVTATGGYGAAGIGGGGGADGGNVVINNGLVKATGGILGAGIGGGAQSTGANVIINGGTVEATGGNGGSGIGDGAAERPDLAKPSTITINGGTVFVRGGQSFGEQAQATGGAAGIGGGAKMPAGQITISGGAVTAIGANDAPGIGHGAGGTSGGTITISGGNVTAYGGTTNPGISCKNDVAGGQDGQIEISGGKVVAATLDYSGKHHAIRGPFSTGTNGNAYIEAKNGLIEDQTKQANWSGIIYEGAVPGKVYGNQTLPAGTAILLPNSLILPNGSTLTISEDAKLLLDKVGVIVEKGATLINNGTIEGIGTLEGEGTITGHGVVQGSIEAPAPAQAEVVFADTTATYGESVTLTAKVEKAQTTNVLTRVAARGKMSFFLKGDGGAADVLLGTATADQDGVYALTIPVSGDKGFKIGENTITAAYGGDMGLTAAEKTAVLTVKPQSQQAPSAPELEKRDRNSITLKAVENNANGAVAEYSKDGGKTWQDTPEFKELTSGTTYQFVVRYKAVGMYGVSQNSPVASFSTESAGGGSSSGSTVTKPDGSTVTTQKNPVTGTVTETTKRPDGSSTIVETQKDGATTTTNKTPSGTTGTVATDKNGQVTEVEGNVSGKDVAQAQKDEQPVKLPVVVPVVSESEKAPHIDIDMPKDSGSVKVELPVENPTGGTVAVIVQPDGVEVPVKSSIVTENSIIVPCDGSTVIKIVDRSKYFADVHGVGHWATDNVDFATARDLFSGTSDTQFSPDLAMTRGMLVTVLYRMEDSPALPEENLGYPFSDVTPDDWYSTAVYWAQSQGIVSGYDDGHFGPKDTITREQMAAILYNYAQYKGYDTTKRADLSPYTDATQIGAWAMEALSWANAEGLVNGTGATMLTPKASATRAQVAAVLTRFYQHVVE